MRRRANLATKIWIRLPRSNFDVRKRSLFPGLVVMDLDRKAACRSGGKSYRGDNVRDDVPFDVVTVKMNTQRLVGGDAHYNFVVL